MCILRSLWLCHTRRTFKHTLIRRAALPWWACPRTHDWEDGKRKEPRICVSWFWGLCSTAVLVKPSIENIVKLKLRSPNREIIQDILNQAVLFTTRCGLRLYSGQSTPICAKLPFALMRVVGLKINIFTRKLTLCQNIAPSARWWQHLSRKQPVLLKQFF